MYGPAAAGNSVDRAIGTAARGDSTDRAAIDIRTDAVDGGG
jgi:hypothetical protein